MNKILTITAIALLSTSFSSISSANLMGDRNKNTNNSNNATSEVKTMANDTWITTQVKTKLISKGWTGVSVETTKGNIVLTGNVKNNNDISEIETLVKGLELKDVTIDNKVQVNNN